MNTNRQIKRRMRIGALFVLASLLFGVVLPLPQAAIAAATASLYFSPTSGTKSVGDTWDVKLYVKSTTQAINAAEATINFPKDLLEVTNVSSHGIFTLWADGPNYSNTAGTVTFSGGLPNPGYKGSAGLILTITVRAKTNGTAKFTITRAKVLANDGEGTNILSGTGTATFTVQKKQVAPPPANTNVAPPPANTNVAPPPPLTTAPTVQSSTNPDPNAWYKARTIQATWSAGADVIGYNALFDQKANSVPDEIDGGLTTSMTRENVDDGIWYLHIRARYPTGWSETTHFAFRIDATGPEPFAITVGERAVTDREATLIFATTDATSGIAKYHLKMGDATFEVTSPYTLTQLPPGTSTVTILASDIAGNVTEATTSLTVEAPTGPTAVLVVPSRRLIGIDKSIPVFLFGESLVLRGVAPLTSRIRILVRSNESVFEFPIEDIPDTQPIEPVPSGYGAWKVEITPDLSVGEHEIHVTTIDQGGIESAEAPVIRFRVVANVASIAGFLIPYSLLVLILGLVSAFFLILDIILLVLYLRLRRHKKKEPINLAKSDDLPKSIATAAPLSDAPPSGVANPLTSDGSTVDDKQLAEKLDNLAGGKPR